MGQTAYSSAARGGTADFLAHRPILTLWPGHSFGSDVCHVRHGALKSLALFFGLDVGEVSDRFGWQRPVVQCGFERLPSAWHCVALFIS